MRISDGSSDVCSSDLTFGALSSRPRSTAPAMIASANPCQLVCPAHVRCHSPERPAPCARTAAVVSAMCAAEVGLPRSEEHTSELQSLMRISYAVFCLKKNKNDHHQPTLHDTHQTY